MVLVLDVLPGKKYYVKIMAVYVQSFSNCSPKTKGLQITSTSHDDGEYIPISPTPKKGYSIQLRLRSHTIVSRGAVKRQYPSLGPSSFLKIDGSYEVPIQMSREATDSAGNVYMIPPKHQGGVAQLRDHVQQRDAVRAALKLAVLAKEEVSGEANEADRLPTGIWKRVIHDTLSFLGL